MKQLQTVTARVYGIVQGVGFRPTVSRHAMSSQVTGNVCNKGPYVEIFAQGAEENVEKFLWKVEHCPPERASILKMDVQPVLDAPEFSSFDIIESAKISGDIFVSPDIAICEKCKKEMYEPGNPRYLHPFINCTCCGPRLTILDSMPYDRVRTSMGAFPMCPSCEYEYTHSETRRYDAQPVCCNACGPEVYLLDALGIQSGTQSDARWIRPRNRMDIGGSVWGREAIIRTRQVIREGGIAAIKGIGGFHLCCDATSEEAVRRLRRLKTRPVKPFAIMMRNLDVVKQECELTPAMEEVLTGHQKPIILLKRKEMSQVCEAAAPGNPKIGVMLPYAPVQLLLFDYDDGQEMPDCLVMTSANQSGAPICRDDADALAELTKLCDVILSHNRLIRLRADDSVMDFFEDKPYMIRRSRGYAPLPFMSSKGFEGEVLAVGGELKNSFCLGKNDLFYPSPYIGDMGDVRTVKALKESIVRMEGLLECSPKLVACDLHPRYNTTYAAQEFGLPILQVQHHYAHILSCMAEHDYDEKVIGISFDGTGYGTDGTIWGGEVLICDYHGFERAGHLEPFSQVGGDISAKEGWRIAVSLIFDAAENEEEAYAWIEAFHLCSQKEAKLLKTMKDRKLNTVVSTSAGRLFDAVSAILNIKKASTFEGEASMSLQFTAEKYDKTPFIYEETPSNLIEKGDEWVLSVKSVIRFLIQKRLAGAPVEALAYWFHEILAEQVLMVCQNLREEKKIHTAALSGGVFQNTLLVSLCCEKLRGHGFTVLTHQLVPPNDGGIALGQVVAAMQKLMDDKNDRSDRG